jgi:hypothetical protein
MSSPDFRQGPTKEKSSKHDLVSKEVSNLLKQGKKDLTTHDLMQLSKKYDDEVVDQIRERFVDTLKSIRAKAKKFASLIQQKYGNRQYPLHKLLIQARKYKQKYNLSDEEFEEFRRIYERRLAGIHDDSRPINMYPRTAIGKTLGNEVYGEAMKVKEDDYETLQKIHQLHAATRALHSQITIQSITYKDVAPEALLGTFDINKHNPHQHVHAVLAGMFIPKIGIFDEHLLLSNIGHIVTAKHRGEPIKTKPDYQLYYDLISDTNDVVCDGHSPVKDLLKRFELQASIWDNVMNLRSGRYYGQWAASFLMAIDNCKIAQYDIPDLLYAGDVGTVMQRILAAFSLRPTIVQSRPLYSVMAPMAVASGHMNQAPKVRALPMIRVTMPYNLQKDDPIYLNDALDQPQWVVDEETKKLLPISQSIIYSRDVLIFYVSRRVNSINISQYTNPYHFNRLPVSISGAEKVNTRPVHFDHSMRVGDEDFVLRSVVCADTHDALGDLVIGSSALIVKKTSDSFVNDSEYFYYNPRRAAEVHPNLVMIQSMDQVQ